MNTTPNWDRHYRLTIVAPIRISKSRVFVEDKKAMSPSAKDNNAYFIVGFLCVDSMSTDVFVKSEEKYYCHIIKSYAALFYTFFKLYRELLQKAALKTTESSDK